ncbi:hypothetical protein KIPB_004105 [Kipferlia bialata]|uniref:Uncharacterized protein n=1 Tax=Kipferlia bialata TaxID=797122 RepID=A0A9K3CV57_9EUKA|nr:hypothetical protein KIPB_004105 [Kipferlia bialata]|eukprot:g4105.t1
MVEGILIVGWEVGVAGAEAWAKEHRLDLHATEGHTSYQGVGVQREVDLWDSGILPRGVSIYTGGKASHKAFSVYISLIEPEYMLLPSGNNGSGVSTETMLTVLGDTCLVERGQAVLESMGVESGPPRVFSVVLDR